LQLIGVIISVAYYVLRKKEIKQEAEMIIDDLNAQAMVSLTQQYH